MPVSDRQNATARFCADHAGALFGLQCGDEDLSGAGSAFTCQYDERKFDRREARNTPHSLRKCLQLKRRAGTIGKLSKIDPVFEKQRSDISHRFSIAAAIRSQIENDAFSAVKHFGQRFRKFERDTLRERVEPEKRNLAFSLVAESQHPLAPVTLQHCRLLLSIATGPVTFTEVPTGPSKSVAIVRKRASLSRLNPEAANL